MIYRYLCEINSREAENMTEEELKRAQRQAKREKEIKKKELEEQRRKDEIDKENKDQYSKSVDYLDTDYNNADKKESANESTIISESTNKKKFISFDPTKILDITGPIFRSTTNEMKKVLKMAQEDKEKIRKSLYNYEKANPDLIKISDMTYTVFNLKKTLNFDTNKGAEKGEEDTEDNPLYDEKIMMKMLGYKFKKDRRANRIVEYFYQDKPSLTVTYTVDTKVGVATDTIESNIVISFATDQFAKHTEYYVAKVSYQRGVVGKQVSSFVAKYYDNSSESTNESTTLSETKSISKSNWDILYKILGDGDSTVAKSVYLINSESYDELYSIFNLSDRNIKKDNYKFIAKYSFINALKKAKLAGSCDWKDDKEEIDFQINKLKNSSKLTLPNDVKENNYGADYLNYINKVNDGNYKLAAFNSDGDEYIFAILDKNQFKMLKENKAATNLLGIGYIFK